VKLKPVRAITLPRTIDGCSYPRYNRHQPPKNTCKQRLRELGWIEGRTVTIEYRWAEDPANTMPSSRPNSCSSRWMSSSPWQARPSQHKQGEPCCGLRRTAGRIRGGTFSASDDSGFVTGIELFVDGGTAQI
jgi:hypothetical protein